jgi:pilus assembly protein TadC
MSEFTLIELSRIARQADSYARWFRYYDELLDAGLSVEEATATIEAAQADERAERIDLRRAA